MSKSSASTMIFIGDVMHTFFIQQIEHQLPEDDIDRVAGYPVDFRYRVLAIRSSEPPSGLPVGSVLRFDQLLTIINNGFKVIVTPYRKAPSYFERDKMRDRKLHVAMGYEARESSMQGKFEILPKSFKYPADANLPPYVDYVGISDLIPRQNLHDVVEARLADALKEAQWKEPTEDIIVHNSDAR